MEQETLVYPLADNTILQDKYTILSVLNAGGFGITYLALDNPGSRYVVIKECMPDAYACRDMETGVVHPRNEQTAVNFSQSVSNSRQEASVLSQLNHPGIVQVFDMFDANGTCYYVMENIQGQTLFDLMTTMHATGQTMEPAQATDLLGSACWTSCTTFTPWVCTIATSSRATSSSSRTERPSSSTSAPCAPRPSSIRGSSRSRPAIPRRNSTPDAGAK